MCESTKDFFLLRFCKCHDTDKCLKGLTCLGNIGMDMEELKKLKRKIQSQSCIDLTYDLTHIKHLTFLNNVLLHFMLQEWIQSFHFKGKSSKNTFRNAVFPVLQIETLQPIKGKSSLHSEFCCNQLELPLFAISLFSDCQNVKYQMPELWGYGGIWKNFNIGGKKLKQKKMVVIGSINNIQYIKTWIKINAWQISFPISSSKG